MYWETQIKFFKYFVKDKKALVKYTLLSIIVGILELFGIALIYPFINKLLSQDTKSTAFIFGGLVILAFIAKNIFMIFYCYSQSNYVKICETEISKIFMNYFLRGDYQKTSKISLSKKMHILGYLPANAINNYLVRILNLTVNLLVFILISGFLFVKFFNATLVTVICAAILLSVQTWWLKRKTASVSQKVLDANEELNLAGNEPLLNLKSVKIQQSEEFFIERFNNKLNDFKSALKDMLFYGMIPPYITEPFVIILLLILLSVISAENINNSGALIASYAVIAAAIFRLTPTISRLQVNLTGINASLPIIRELVNYYEEFGIKKQYTTNERISFNQSIELKNVSFSYLRHKDTLKNINLKINKGDFIGIAGASGAGKTTLADILSGLLEIKSGELYVDGTQIQSKRLPNLNIGYIPQDIGILYGSIRENVAFAQSDIDDEKVIEALKKACIYDFIIDNFPEGIYATPFTDSIGFSQGQKQRLSIARALYSNPDIIIMDEGTSALDLETENEICTVLNKLKGEKTIITIAHRLSTIKNSDNIILLENCTIETSGTFDELCQKSPYFKHLAELNRSDSV